MSKKYCPLGVAMRLFGNDSEKLVDFTMNCRSLSMELYKFSNSTFNFDKLVVLAADVTRINECLRVAPQNWEEDNYNISANHIQLVGFNKDYSVLHFGRVNGENIYIDFSVQDEGNNHYVSDRPYVTGTKDNFALVYTLDDFYNMLKKAFYEYVDKEKEKAVAENYPVETAEEECTCEGECTCETHEQESASESSEEE